jgi:AcrR family transcriptional regulator
MSSDSRQRMIESASELFRERGYSGTGFREINAKSGVARGAIYHHFPRGKAEVGEEVIRGDGVLVAAAIDAAAQDLDAVGVVRAFVDGWRAHLIATEFRAGCAIVGVLAESNPDAPGLARASADAFRSWRAALAASFRKSGIPAARARRLATLTVAAVEGAVLMSRAEGTTRALDESGQELVALVAAASGA